jgi:thiol-disulfide isomerase/thioredoxin
MQEELLMNLFDKYQQGLSYTDFLARYANDGQKQRWRQVHEQVALTPPQRELLTSFVRTTHVLCLAGAWCGDCINQCPIFEHFAAAALVLRVRYLDRDEHAEVQQALQVNGGNRVPVVVFFSEDGFEVARYGERTLSKYRQMVRDQLGASCPTGIVPAGDPLLAQVTQDWLNEFERVQWLLRLSPRLRQLHAD